MPLRMAFLRPRDLCPASAFGGAASTGRSASGAICCYTKQQARRGLSAGLLFAAWWTAISGRGATLFRVPTSRLLEIPALASVRSLSNRACAAQRREPAPKR